jgi:hypothetical protein
VARCQHHKQITLAWTARRSAELAPCHKWERRWIEQWTRGAQSVAYLTKRPVEACARSSRNGQDEQLLTVLRTKPVLFVQGGVERPLLAYHRHDAATYPMP